MSAIELKDGLPDHLQMRDYFAAHALTGLLSCADIPNDSAITMAYEVADLMMTEREKSKDAAMRST